MHSDFQADVDAIARIKAIPALLEVVCEVTGMGFAAVARVTEDRWIACGVRDEIAFGLQTGGELKLETTICHEIQQNHEAVIINNVAEDMAYRGHPAPAMYGFQSYISVPIILLDGSFFGTLCAIDPRPARLDTLKTTGMFKLFAELIALHINTNAQLASSEATLVNERKTAELREQFIAVLGHDLRSPLSAISAGTEILAQRPLDEKASRMVTIIQKSVARIAGIIDDVMDFARGRLGSGVPVERTKQPLKPVLEQIVSEARASFPDRMIETQIAFDDPVVCDQSRIGQLLSNLLGNALSYGVPNRPIGIRAGMDGTVFELSVTNVGDPIPPATMERLFQPFARGAARPSQQGLGLGLFIASEVARAHNGTIEVTSSPEETRFTFRMPLTLSVPPGTETSTPR